MDHYKPHVNCAFEGYYSKFALPSGAHLALIISSVHNANSKPFMLSINYISRDSKKFWQRIYWPEQISFVDSGPSSFNMQIPGFGSVKCSADTVTYDVKTDEFSLTAETQPGTRQPWLSGDHTSTPAGLLVHAPLPIQWHVHSLSTAITFSISLSSLPAKPLLHKSDHSGTCIVHQEKNWARSFPDKYIWVRAWDAARSRGLCVAGGEALKGVEAYLLTYTSRDGSSKTITFTPPWTFSILGFSPFCKTVHDYDNRTLSLDVSNLFTRLQISSAAAADTFFPLCCPMTEGHRANSACESFAARHSVKVWKRGWPWSNWRLVQQDEFKNGALEFGGEYYHDADKKRL